MDGGFEAQVFAAAAVVVAGAANAHGDHCG